MTLHTDLMIDLETLGTQPGSVITQVGLCAFDAFGKPNESTTIARLYRVDPKSCMDLGMTASWPTIKWWMGQSQEARENFTLYPADPVQHVIGVLVKEFMQFYCEPNFKVWGNGSCFDVVMMEDLYRRLKIDIPWDYHNIRDMRTLRAIAPPVEEVKARVEHDACADAQAQALTVQRMTAALSALAHPAV